jgi:hypothetical protein
VTCLPLNFTTMLQVLAEVRCLRDDNQQLAQELAGLRSSTASSSSGDSSSSSSSADYKALAAKARKLERHNARLTLLLRDVRDNFAKVTELSLKNALYGICHSYNAFLHVRASSKYQYWSLSAARTLCKLSARCVCAYKGSINYSQVRVSPIVRACLTASL